MPTWDRKSHIRQKSSRPVFFGTPCRKGCLCQLVLKTSPKVEHRCIFEKNIPFFSAWSIVSGGFIAAVLVTGVVYLIGVDGLLNTKERRRISSSPYYPDQYQYQQYGQDRWGRRQDGFVHQMEKILSFLSVEAMQVPIDVIVFYAKH